MKTQHGGGLAALTLTCSVDKQDVQSAWTQHRHSAQTWACSKDMDIEHGHGRAALKWTYGIDMDMQHQHEQAAWI